MIPRSRFESAFNFWLDYEIFKAAENGEKESSGKVMELLPGLFRAGKHIVF